MRKKQLLIFLDRVENKAIKSVAAKHSKIIRDAKINILNKSGYMGRLCDLQDRVNSLHSISQELELDLKDDISIRYNYSDLPTRYLNSCTGKDRLINEVILNAKFDGGIITLLKNDEEKEIAEVRANYSKVKAVISGYTKAKKIAEYLESLGFDLTSIREADNAPLQCIIDKDKLFVCGENS